jgi:hypothetical protein
MPVDCRHENELCGVLRRNVGQAFGQWVVDVVVKAARRAGRRATPRCGPRGAMTLSRRSADDGPLVTGAVPIPRGTTTTGTGDTGECEVDAAQ